MLDNKKKKLILNFYDDFYLLKDVSRIRYGVKL